MANIIVLGVKVPFTKGGQDVLVGSLICELNSGRYGSHEVDLVELPYTALPKKERLSQAAAWRNLNLQQCGDKNVDLVIATKFPSYFVKHRRKSVWLVHQLREAYDLFGTRYSDFSDDPRDEVLRRALMRADSEALSEAAFVAGISKNVSQRLQTYNGISATHLYPPLPEPEKYFCGTAQNYILSVGRLCSIKRVDLMIKAMPFIHQQIVLKIVGTPDEPGVFDYFSNEIEKHHLWPRVEFLGKVGQEELRSLYANALAVYYAPHNEDYGYVTLEAMASSKPIVTAHDSGGVLEFIEHQRQGLVVEPTSIALGMAVNRLVEDPQLAINLGAAGREKFSSLGLSWQAVISGLLSPLQQVHLQQCGLAECDLAEIAA